MKENWGGRIGASLRWSAFLYFDEMRSRKMLKLDRPHGTITLMSPTRGAVDNHETFYGTQTTGCDCFRQLSTSVECDGGENGHEWDRMLFPVLFPLCTGKYFRS